MSHTPVENFVRKPRVQRLVRDALLIVVGSLLFAVGIDCFEAPNGIAAGGITGLATVTNYLAAQRHILLPIGLQVMVANVLLLIPVIRAGGLRYAVKTVAGLSISSIFVDLLQPILPVYGGDLLLSCIWGGVLCGAGVGLVFRSGGNTGGTDIMAQLLSRRTSLSVGTWALIADLTVVIISIPVFSLENALYAAVAMYISSRLVDYVVDGPSTTRAAYIISDEREKIGHAVLYEMDRGCTQIEAKGMWSGETKPMLMVILSRSEVGTLKSIVSELDPDALVVISEVHEAFGEGFRRITAE